jgi:hypothetical protein
MFNQLWANYVSAVIDAQKIETSLRDKGDVWNEDHVAFRTLPGEHTGMHVLQSLFECFGYERKDNYHFEDKQLKAFWMQPPNTSEKMCKDALPKIFISELMPDRFSSEFKKILHLATAQVVTSPISRMKNLAEKAKTGDVQAKRQLVEEGVAFLSSEAPWARPRIADYEVLRKESEYAAWTLVFGFSINHFTVSAHLMNSFKTIQGLNQHIETSLKIPMNASGGLTKGTPELKLVQSSTLASQIPVLFQDGLKTLPYAFVEFAFRYPLEGKKDDGMWNSYYQGFVTNNADKIFESTNLR